MLVIHGGAGVEPGDLTPAGEEAARAALREALKAGYAKLQAGASSVDAVTTAITVLEDAPQFNAGRGAVFTHDGRNELDTSLMDGASGKAGAAAGLHRVKNPITLARARLGSLSITRCRPATPTSRYRLTVFPMISAVTAASSATGPSDVPALTTAMKPGAFRRRRRSTVTARALR